MEHCRYRLTLCLQFKVVIPSHDHQKRYLGYFFQNLREQSDFEVRERYFDGMTLHQDEAKV